MKKLMTILMSASLLAGVSSVANAAISLRVSDLNTTDSTTIGNDSALDTAQSGDEVFAWQDFSKIVASGTSFGVGNWAVDATGSTSDSTPYVDAMHLDSVEVSSSTGGTVEIAFSQTDMGRGKSPIFGQTSFALGSSTGSIVFELWADASNAAFGKGTLLYSGNGPTAPDFFSSSLPQMASDYSLTMLATITHDAKSSGTITSSFNYDVQIPAPGTLALLGLGLIGLGLSRKRKA